jgi:hypothetical protein
LVLVWLDGVCTDAGSAERTCSWSDAISVLDFNNGGSRKPKETNAITARILGSDADGMRFGPG